MSRTSKKSTGRAGRGVSQSKFKESLSWFLRLVAEKLSDKELRAIMKARKKPGQRTSGTPTSTTGGESPKKAKADDLSAKLSTVGDSL